MVPRELKGSIGCRRSGHGIAGIKAAASEQQIHIKGVRFACAVAPDTESGACCCSDCHSGRIGGRKGCKGQPKQKRRSERGRIGRDLMYQASH